MSRNFLVHIILLFLAELASCMDSEEHFAWDGSFFDEALGCLAGAGFQACIASASTSPFIPEAIERALNLNQPEHPQDYVEAERYVRGQSLDVPVSQQPIDVSYQPPSEYRYPSPEQPEPQCYYAQPPLIQRNDSLADHISSGSNLPTSSTNTEQSTSAWLQGIFTLLPIFPVLGKSIGSSTTGPSQDLVQSAHGNHQQPGSSETSDRQSQSFASQNKKPGKDYHCTHDQCAKSFGSRSSLKKHRKSHIEEKDRPHPCPFENCKRRFIWPKDVRKHQLTHDPNHDDRHYCPYSGCPAAARPIVRIDNFRRHLHDQHGEPSASEQASVGGTGSWTWVEESTETTSRA